MIAFLSLFLHVLVSPLKTRASAERAAPARSLQAETDGRRSIDLRLALSAVSIRVERPLSDRAGDRASVASDGFPIVLALEVALSWRSAVIREMSLANRLWGAPRIHGELLKLGIEVARSTVAKYMAKSGRGRSQTWQTFLQNHAAGIAAVDFLIVPTVGFRLLCFGHPQARTPAADKCNRQPNGGVDRPPDHRSLPVG